MIVSTNLTKSLNYRVDLVNEIIHLGQGTQCKAALLASRWQLVLNLINTLEIEPKNFPEHKVLL